MQVYRPLSGNILPVSDVLDGITMQKEIFRPVRLNTPYQLAIR